MTSQVSLVLPLYNEENRLDLDALSRLAAATSLSVLIVDDGSRDRTVDVVRSLVDSGAVRLLQLERNMGKGEAVRRGMLHEIDRGASLVGYADGDFATPVEELLRLASMLLARPDTDAVLSSRVRLAGRRVERRTLRHYLGRAVATVIDLRVRLGVYDTQCGAKFFRVRPSLRLALERPFATRWLFDVEILARLRDGSARLGHELRLHEEPLESWTDVSGSRLRGRELMRVARDFVALERELRALRRHRDR